jgi:hypothetical protein
LGKRFINVNQLIAALSPSADRVAQGSERGERVMSGTHTVWHTLEQRRSRAANRERSGVMIAVALLCVMAAAEVLFLRFVAGPDSVNLISAAEGIPATE